MLNKSIFVVLLILFIIICIICVTLINFNAEKSKIQNENMLYEKYLNKKILGTELATIINRAINQNEENKVLKDEKGYYIDNYKNSIKIDLKMNTIEKTYPMEEIYKSKTATFVQNFNEIYFECIKIEYHKNTGRISKLIFEELY